MCGTRRIGYPPSTSANSLERSSLITRTLMRMAAFIERLNVRFSRVGNPPIYDKAVSLSAGAKALRNS